MSEIKEKQKIKVFALYEQTQNQFFNLIQDSKLPIWAKNDQKINSKLNARREGDVENKFSSAI